MLTASHNPASYNGMKFCRSGARAIGADTGLTEIRQLAARPARSAAVAGSIQQINLLDEFVEHVQSFIDVGALRPLKIVADTANGMGGLILPAAFNELPFELEILYEELDGTFPNHPADPLQPENLVDLQKRVSESNADVGLAFDGDADRVFLVDEKANLVSGSVTTALVASEILESEGPGPILHNLICSRATVEAIEEAGGEPIRTRVGHSYIKAIMAETGAMFGGVELSDDIVPGLRELTERYGVIFIMDEVVTGFRCAPGGAQEHYGVKPDLSTLAKIVAAGLNGGALVAVSYTHLTLPTNREV